MDCVTLLSNMFSSGAGAFAGGLAAYLMTCRRDKQKQTAEYLNLLLIIYSDLDSIHHLFANIPENYIKEIDGEKVVVLDMLFPELHITSQQIQIFLDVAPDKQMIFGLIGMQHFLETHARRIECDGVNILPVGLVEKMKKQLEIMLLSARVQYEQETKSDFPFYEITLNELSQKKQQTR